MSVTPPKIKKKIKKRQNDDDTPINDTLNFYNDLEYFTPVYVMDTANKTYYMLKSHKGHFTYYSKKTMITGDYYFEVTMNMLDFDMVNYIKSKCIDDVKKMYYDSILTNIKQYMPTVRIGIINDKTDHEIPIGAEGNSYAYRSKDGALIIKGDYTLGNDQFKTGDIVGCFVHLKPPKPDFLKAEDSQAGINDINEECYVKFYINGIEQPMKIEGLVEGNYQFGVTLYNYAEAHVNFKPDIKRVPIEINNLNYL